MTAKLLFFPARANHLDEVMHLLRDAREWHLDARVEPWPTFDPGMVLANINDNLVFVLVHDGELVGTVTLFESDPLIWKDGRPALYIHRLTTSRRMKGLGLGRAIVRHVEDMAIDLNKASLRLDCWAHNEGLKRYYESIGFVRLRDLFMGQERSLPAHYWNSTTTLFEKHCSKGCAPVAEHRERCVQRIR